MTSTARRERKRVEIENGRGRMEERERWQRNLSSLSSCLLSLLSLSLVTVFFFSCLLLQQKERREK